MQRELPCYNTDSAVIYRSLKELEEEGAVNRTGKWTFQDQQGSILLKNYVLKGVNVIGSNIAKEEKNIYSFARTHV
jgi:predicted 3-demethylubiquinone-9 3-methyltransferase (glyoxalase superfamily)